MANHRKRKSPNQRAGCNLCKPWKRNGVIDRPASEIRVTQTSVIDALTEYEYYDHPYYYDPDYEDDWWDDQGLLEFLQEYNVK